MICPVLEFPTKPPAGIALFDLDGTLIAWDCQVLFRHFIVREEPWRAIFLPVFLVFLPLAGVLGAEGMKRVFLSYLWMMSSKNLEKYSREFAVSLMPLIYPKLLEKIKLERDAGHMLILTSASPEFYVADIGRELGFDLTIGTQVQLGALFPDLENNKGYAKVDRLENILPSSYFDFGKLRNCHGYTDSCADLPMLTLCDLVTVVNPSRRLTDLASASSWEILRPTRPWKSRLEFGLRMVGLIFGWGKDPGKCGW
jgi:phosphatidylglycerophosphatase C